MKYLLILLSGFEISDGIITSLVIGNGLIQESNPWVEPIASEGNFLLLKVIGVLLSVLILWGVYKRFPKLALTAASSVVIFYAVVLVWNFGVLFRA